VSRDGGASFEAERKVTDHTCECCRIAMAVDPAGRIEAVWRNVFPGQIRDHALAVLPIAASEPVVPLRATFELAGRRVPERGPARDHAGRHAPHRVVRRGRRPRRRVLFAHRRRRRPRGAPWAFGANPAAPDEQASHAALVARGDIVWLAWKAFDGDTMHIRLRRSDDRGEHWSAPRDIASTSGASDNPQLLDDAGRIYVSWRTRNDGYRLIPVEGAQ
jgi:hypothetical protein